MEQKIATVFKNGDNYNGKVLVVQKSMEEFLEHVSNKLNFDAKRLFSKNGAEIDDIEVIRDKDVLYATDGEDFYSFKANIVKLNVGGTYFCTTLSTLIMKEPDSILAKMFSCQRDLSPASKDEDGSYFIDRSPEYFHTILQYLRTSKIFPDNNMNLHGRRNTTKHPGYQRSPLHKRTSFADVHEEVAAGTSVSICSYDEFHGKRDRLCTHELPSSHDQRQFMVSGELIYDPDPPAPGWAKVEQLPAFEWLTGLIEEAKYYGLNSLVQQIGEYMGKYVNNIRLTRRDVMLKLLECRGGDILRFQGADLSEADLSHLDLSHINFKYANLSKCNLSTANLSGCVFAWANLSDAVLDNAQLSLANMQCANMENASLIRCDFEDPKGGRAALESVNLRNANLEGSNMVRINLRVARLKNANLQNCDLREATLAGSDLENCNLSGANLLEANLRGANLKGASLEMIQNPLHMAQTIH